MGGVEDVLRRLVLVKHSLPEIKRDRPASAWRLGDVGRQRSELLASRLRDFNTEVVWSSREAKAVQTAEIVAGALSVPVQVVDGLEEHHRDSVPFYPTTGEFEAAVERFFCNPDQLVLGVETGVQARDRMAAAIGRVVDAGHTDNIVVTHGTVMTLYVANVTGARPMDFWRRLGLPSYVVLELPGNRILSTVETL